MSEPLREMTMAEYLRWKLMDEVRRDAEKEGIRIIPSRPKPQLISAPVIQLVKE